MIRKGLSAAILFSATLLGSCASRPSADYRPEICFQSPLAAAAAPALADGEGAFTESMLDKQVELGGCLEDTSAIDVLFPNVYDGFRIYSNRLYVKNRIYEKPLSGLWCLVDARISRVDVKNQDLNEVEILAYHPIDMAPVNAALEESAMWVEKHRREIDFNELKKSQEFQRSGAARAAAGLDINRAPYRAKKNILGIDPRRGVAQFLCGSYVLEEVPHHHGDYVQIMAVYDLKARRILRIIVDRGGFYEE